MLPNTPIRLAPLVALVLFLLGSLPLDARTRFHEYTEQFFSRRDGALPLAASYLGGGGNEYLTGAAFLPDGGLLLAGNALGPEFSLRGVQVSVIGSDTASAPDFSMPRGRNDNIASIRSWQQQQGAGFVVQLSPDYRRIVRAVRLPWNSGVITDLTIDGEGQIWLTGRVGERFSDLGNARPLGVDGFAGDGESFIAKLSPNWGGVAWLARVPDDAESTPALRYLGNGIMSWVGEHGLHLNSSGEAVHASLIGYSRSWMRGVNFENFEYATGGMRHTRNDRNGNNFRADSVQIGNKTRVVFFGGAAQNEKFKPINPLQPFSGGDIDGLFIVLEMDTLAPATIGEPPFSTAGSREAGVGEGDEGLSGKFHDQPWHAQ